MTITKYQALTQSRNSKQRKKGYKKVVSDIEDKISTGDVDSVIRVLKQSGYFINDKHSQSIDASKLIEICDEAFHNSSKWKKTNSRLEKESAIINEKFDDIKIRLNSLNASIPEGLRTFVYLMGLEVHLRRSFMLGSRRIVFHRKFEEALIHDDMLNQLIETSGTVLSHFKHVENTASINPLDIDFVEIMNDMEFETTEYLNLSSVWRNLQEIADMWSASDIEIVVENGHVEFDCKTALASERLIAFIAFMDVSNAKQFKQIFYEMLNPITNTLGYVFMKPRLYQLERMDMDFINDAMFMGEDSLTKSGIPISQILRAYNSLRFISEKKIRKSKFNLKVRKSRDLVFIESKDYWIKLFIKAGVSKDLVNEVFELLVFGDQSADILDSPLYPFGEYFILLPTATFKINSSKSLLSLLNSKDKGLDIKGYVFEKHLHSVVQKSDCKVETYKKKVNGEEFECDLIIAIGNDVLLVEAKNYSPDSSFRDYENRVFEMESACNQLNRIAKHIEDNEQLEEILGIEKVNSITKVVVSSISVGCTRKYNDVYITDEVYFSAFFLRKCPSAIVINHQKKEHITIRQNPFLYEGKMTIDQFKTMLEMDSVKGAIKRNRISSENFNMNNFGYTQSCYRESIGSFTFKEDASIDDAKVYL